MPALLRFIVLWSERSVALNKGDIKDLDPRRFPTGPKSGFGRAGASCPSPQEMGRLAASS